MNTHHAHIIATVCAALCLGATACGTEGRGASPAASIRQPAGQQESRISPLAAERQGELEAQARELRAEHAHTRCAPQGHPTSGETAPNSRAARESRACPTSGLPHSPAGVEGWAR